MYRAARAIWQWPRLSMVARIQVAAISDELDADRCPIADVSNVSRRQKHSKCVHFDGFCVDPSNFRVKIHEISMLFAKCYLNVAKTAPDMKIRAFWKALPRRG